jgi:hypothetical protein
MLQSAGLPRHEDRRSGLYEATLVVIHHNDPFRQQYTE